MFLLLCLVALGGTAYGKALSKDVNIKACHLSDPEINPCILEQLRNAVQILPNGIPKRGLVPLEPFNLEFMTIDADIESFKVKLMMKNINVYGYSNTKFYSFKFDPDTLSGEVSYRIPFLRMTCDYSATGKLFSIPLNSTAFFDGNATNKDITLSFRLKTVERKGKEYYTIDKTNAEIKIESGRIQLKSLDPNQQPQVKLIQDFFNENDKLVLNTIKPIENERGAYFYKHIFESYIRRIPASELLPR